MMSHKIKTQHAINQATLSSNVKEVISTILNFFYFFTKRFQVNKKLKTHISEQK